MAYIPPITDVTSTGSAGANATTFAPVTLNGQQTLAWYTSGTFVASYQVQLSVDGTNFINFTGNAGIYITSSGATSGATLSASGVSYHINVAGYAAARFITTAYTSGTVNIAARATIALASSIDGVAQTSQQGSITATLNTGTNSIGSAVMLTAAGVNVLTGNGVTGTGSLRVTLATDTSTNTNPLLVSEQKSATATQTNVASSTTSVTIQALNTARKGFYIYNESTAVLYLSFAATASATAYIVQIPAAGFYEMPVKPIYTGIITGIWSSANGTARVTELV